MESIGMMTRTHHYRKVMKPLLERKRRARINKCLDEIKDLVLECMEQQGDNIAKLEKADVLELAVNHLRKLRQTGQQPSSAHSFRLGFVQAANEVSRALASSPKVDVNLGTKLMTHLGHRLNEIQAQQEMEKRASLVAVTPLTVVCSENYHQSQLSPASSGYGSDLECSSSTKGLLQLADDVSEAEKNIWRPW